MPLRRGGARPAKGDARARVARASFTSGRVAGLAGPAARGLLPVRERPGEVVLVHAGDEVELQPLRAGLGAGADDRAAAEALGAVPLDHVERARLPLRLALGQEPEV